MFEVVVVSRRYPFARGTSHARGVAYGASPATHALRLLARGTVIALDPLRPRVVPRARLRRPFARNPIAPRDRAWSRRRPAPGSRDAPRATHPTTSLLPRVPTLTMTSSAAAAAAAAASSPSASSDDALFLGLDFGTSGAGGAVVVDASGDVRHESVAKYPIVDGGKGGDGIPDGGWAEAWRGALWTLLDRVPSEVSSASRWLSAARPARCSWWMVPPAAHLPPHALQRKTPGCHARRGGVAPGTHRAQPRRARCVSYIRGGRSRLRRRRRRAAKLLHHADWIAFLLHGEMGVTDHNNALKLGFDPAGEGSYPSWLSGAPYASTLPARVLSPGTRAGTVASAEARSRLPEGCVVVAGTTDSVAAFVAARCTSPGTASRLWVRASLKMVASARGRFRQGGVQSSPVRRLARRRRVQPRRMASPLVLHRRRTRDAHRADGRRANGLGRRSIISRAFSWGSGSPSRKPPRRSSRDPTTTSRSCAPSSNPSRGWRREVTRRWSTWAPVTRPPACSPRGRGRRTKNGVAFGRER